MNQQQIVLAMIKQKIIAEIAEDRALAQDHLEDADEKARELRKLVYVGPWQDLTDGYVGLVPGSLYLIQAKHGPPFVARAAPLGYNDGWQFPFGGCAGNNYQMVARITYRKPAKKAKRAPRVRNP